MNSKLFQREFSNLQISSFSSSKKKKKKKIVRNQRPSRTPRNLHQQNDQEMFTFNSIQNLICQVSYYSLNCNRVFRTPGTLITTTLKFVKERERSKQSSRAILIPSSYSENNLTNKGRRPRRSLAFDWANRAARRIHGETSVGI